LNLRLLDSNAYFRLAKSFHPLLGGPYGEDKIVLKVLEDVDIEFSKSPRLDSKFSWVSEAEYTANRKNNLLPVVGNKADDIRHASIFIREWGRDQAGEFRSRNITQPSKVDCTVLAYGYAMGIAIVSDDAGMAYAAKAFDVLQIESHELLKELLDADIVTIQKIQTAMQYLDWLDDLPPRWRREAKKLFGISSP
jgi:hypothetical protein